MIFSEVLNQIKIKTKWSKGAETENQIPNNILCFRAEIQTILKNRQV